MGPALPRGAEGSGKLTGNQAAGPPPGASSWDGKTQRPPAKRARWLGPRDAWSPTPQLPMVLSPPSARSQTTWCQGQGDMGNLGLMQENVSPSSPPQDLN